MSHMQAVICSNIETKMENIIFIFNEQIPPVRSETMPTVGRGANSTPTAAQLLASAWDSGAKRNHPKAHNRIMAITNAPRTAPQPGAMSPVAAFVVCKTTLAVAVVVPVPAAGPPAVVLSTTTPPVLGADTTTGAPPTVNVTTLLGARVVAPVPVTVPPAAVFNKTTPPVLCADTTTGAPPILSVNTLPGTSVEESTIGWLAELKEIRLADTRSETPGGLGPGTPGA